MPINNGPIYNAVAGEWLVWLDGMPITWASTEKIGWNIYNEARRVSDSHKAKNPDEPAWEWYTLEMPNKDEVVKALNECVETEELAEV